MFKIISLLALLMFSSSAFAGEQSNFNRSRVSHSWGSAQVTQGHDVKSDLGKDTRMILSLQYDHVAAPFKLINQDGAVLTEVVDSFSRVRLGAGFQLSREWFLAVSIPFDNVSSKPFRSGEQNLNIINDPFSQSYSGLGDIELVARRRLEAFSLRWNWVLELLATLPTGDEDSFNQDGDFSIGARMAFMRHLGFENQFATYGYLGFRYAPNSVLSVNPLFLPFESEKRFEFGAGLRHQTLEDMGLFAEASGFLSLPFDEGQNPIDISLGADYSFGPDKSWRAYAGFGLESLFGEEFSNDSRVFLGLKKVLLNLDDKQQERFSESKYIEYSLSDQVLLDSIGEESSLVKRLVGKTHSAYFVSGGSKITQEGKRQAIELASHLIKHQRYISEVNIVGFADSRGEKSKNLMLSKGRANELKNVLISYGVDPTILKIVAEGEASRKEADSFGRLNNRRADAYISKISVRSLSVPKKENVNLSDAFKATDNIDFNKSESLVREDLFPKPFVMNDLSVSKFSLLTEDNLTWGEISQRVYGTKGFKDILKKINYHRQPSLGDVLFFVDPGKKSLEKGFQYFKWM